MKEFPLIGIFRPERWEVVAYNSQAKEVSRAEMRKPDPDEPGFKDVGRLRSPLKVPAGGYLMIEEVLPADREAIEQLADELSQLPGTSTFGVLDD